MSGTDHSFQRTIDSFVYVEDEPGGRPLRRRPGRSSERRRAIRQSMEAGR